MAKPRTPRDQIAMDQIRAARQSKGMSLTDVAEILGTTRQWVSGMERCRFACPPATLTRLREIVGLMLVLMLAACGAECEHPDPQTVADMCAEWQWGGSIIEDADGWLTYTDQIVDGDLGPELCL